MVDGDAKNKQDRPGTEETAEEQTEDTAGKRQQNDRSMRRIVFID